MSAIFGLYQRAQRPVAREELQDMSDILAHRGTDGAGVWTERSVGLGHRMLWTTPESLKEGLPLDEKSSGLVITADARIDNRKELADLLEIKGSLAEMSDSEFILAAYAKWGEQCPRKLVGDFAFAIWDRKNQKLFCARDHIGVRSLYYYLSEHVFAFATEIKALLCLPGVPRQLNETRVADFLVRSVEDRTSTFYQHIVRLPAAHTITVDASRSQIRRYWSLDPARKVRMRSDEDYAEAFRTVFNEAVSCRVRSAFPVGSTLSGGLDSSSIACTARNQLKQRGVRLHTFSAIFPSLPERDLRGIDERKYMEAVISQGGFEPHFLRADLISPLSDFDKILWHWDEVYFGPNLYIHWGLYGAAQERGVRVFLDGLDGDTTVSHGLAFLTELAWTGRWMKLLSEARGLSKVRSSLTSRKIVWEYGFKPLIPNGARRLLRTLRGQPRQTDAATGILNQAFAERIDMPRRVRELQSKSGGAVYTSRQSHFKGLNFALHPYVLELADKAAAAFGVEPRYPFYDRRLMEFCLAVPPEQKLSQGWTRAIMRRAMTDVLPPQVRLRRDKANLSSNFNHKLYEYDQKLIKSAYQTQSIKKYVDEETLKSTYERYISGPSTGKKDALTVYSVAALSLWLQKSNPTWESRAAVS